MEREKLHDFVVLSETLNFSRAADRLFMSQSALSKRMQSLEKELGDQLFFRDARGIRLTEFGSRFLPFARQILTGYESADMFLQRYRKHHRRQVVLGSVANPECYHIDKIFVGFEQAHPDIQLDLKEKQLTELDQMFHSGLINLYCTCDLLLRDDTMFIPAGNGYLVTLCPVNDPLSGKELISPQDLSDRNLLLPLEVDPFYTAVIKKFKDAEVTPNVVYKGAGISGISLVQAGVGVAILPVEIAQKYTDSSIKLIPFSPEIKYEFGLGYKPMAELSETERVFVNYVKSYFGI